MVCSQERGEREANKPRGPGDYSGVPLGGQFYRGRGRSYRHAQTGRPAHRGSLASHSSYSAHSGQSTFNALPTQSSYHASPAQASTDVVASDVVITGIVSVCHKEASILFDPGSTYSYVSSYFAYYPDMPCESLVLPVCVSTPVGDIITVNRVHRSCVVSIGELETVVDLLLLDMVDFNVILDMYWLSPCHAILNCHAKIVTLKMSGLPKVEWRGSLEFVPSGVISYLKAQCMVGKRYLSYLAFVRDIDVDTPIIDSVPVVRDFPDVFPADLPGMLPDRDIDFGIDVVQGTHPTSIPLYRMASAELKELKEQLQKLL
ncbi:uncharacterized protein [Nicotiana tomentosiformis]|uniref:uncharacterized protein n=1 Tax=Nicotiana tomentosiformis TaxID=4098 RepID=UPI00388CCD4E